jgi:predicted metal-dependent hydrolase
VFCFAVDLFNHGYYWEAHETWESLWHASGRAGTAGDFLRSLIKIAAAGVKAREGRPEGWRRHLRRAEELLTDIQRRIGPNTPRYFGLELAELMAAVAKARDTGPPADAATDEAVRVVFPFQLLPQ